MNRHLHLLMDREELHMLGKAMLSVSLLTKAGHEAYIVGGYPRDVLICGDVKMMDYADVDVTTSASPEEVKEILSPVINHFNFVGKNFGVVIADGLEIAMFRTETYEVSGKPTVKRATSLAEDLSRRDFTINTICLDKNLKIIDLNGAKTDIENKLIRAVGHPSDRFIEDPSRILRALYFAARFQFDIEHETGNSIRENAHLLSLVPDELKGKILRKVASYKKMSAFIRLLHTYGLLSYVFPELAHTPDQPQNPKYHHLNVFEHIVKVVEQTEMHHPNDEVMLYASIFHDNQKATPSIRGINREGQPSDIGHEEAGAPIAYAAVTRFGFGKKLAKEVRFLVLFHGINIEEGMKKKTVIRLLKKMVPYCRDKQTLHASVQKLFAFMEMDARGFTPAFRDEVIPQKNSALSLFNEVLAEKKFYIHELTVDGSYLSRKGLKGSKIGEALKHLLELDLPHSEMIEYIDRKYALSDASS